MRFVALVALCTFSLLPHELGAIVIRHDVSDQEYRVAADDYPYIAEVANATGVLISPRWVMTAAHVAKYIEPGGIIRAGGQQSQIDEVFVHPNTELFFPDVWEHDLALIRLSAPIEIDSYPKLDRSDGQKGKLLFLLGRGGTGTGEQGDVIEDGVLRRATNRVDAMEGTRLVFVFDEPENASQLEGVSGVGDSGGPALRFEGDKAYVVGISSLQDSKNGPPGKYGVIEYYERVYAHLPWLDRVLSADTAQRARMAYRAQPCQSMPISREALAEYIGVYEFDGGTRLEVIAEDDTLFRTNPRRRLIHCGDDRFSYEIFDIELEFRRDETGAVDTLTFKQWYATTASKTDANTP